MRIYQPDLGLTQADHDALALLAQLALASEGEAGSNVLPGAVTFSPAEARNLLGLLEQFADSKMFVEGSYFAEGMVNGEGWIDERLRGIYLSWRSKRGRSRIMSGNAWREFVFRLGFNSSQDAWMWPAQMNRSPLRPMAPTHFLAMEKRLVLSVKLHPRVNALIVDFVSLKIPALERLRDKSVSIPKGTLRRFVAETTREISDHIGGKEKAPMSKKKIVALSTIIMDTAVLFTTRDWTAAGVMSSIAAVVPDALD